MGDESRQFVAGMMLLVLVSAAARAGADGGMQPVCLEVTGVREVSEEHPELTGERVRVGLVELSQSSIVEEGEYAFMPNVEHQGLIDSDLQGFYYYASPHLPVCYSSHASMIVGILFGDDPRGSFDQIGPFEYRGIVPEAMVDVYETNWFIYRQVIAADAAGVEADVLNISWGTDANDVVTMWWQEGIDAMVERDRCVVVAGCGNGRSEFDDISKPSWGHNVISVGAARSVGSFPKNLELVGPPIPDESSFGPTSDGRTKPDIIAPGLSLGPCAESDEDYCYPGQVGSSSYGAAHVTGAAALLIDAARYEQIAEGDDPRVIKAVLLNGADKLNGWHKGKRGVQDDREAPLDYGQGAGMLNFASSYAQLMGTCDANATVIGSGWWLDSVALDSDSDGAAKVHRVGEGLEQGDEVKATLVWYRHYEQGAGRDLSLLSLELWSVDQEGLFKELLDHSISQIDNVQHIYYRCERARRVALVVRGLGGELAEETYALAYTSEQENWPGDQMAGDFNADGIVDSHDLAQWVQRWVSESTGVREEYAPEDINSDGRIDQIDFNVLSQQWRQSSDWYRGSVGQW